MTDASQHSFAKLKRLFRYVKGERQWIDSFLRLRLGWRRRNEEIVKRGSRARSATLLKAYTRKQKIIARCSAEAELYAAALGASEAKGVESMLSDLGFVVKPELIIDAKATGLILHGHEVGKMKHVDVAHVWLQDEVKSNRSRVRRVKSEDNLADIGTKALSKRIIIKHAISMVNLDVQENLRSGDVMGLTDQSKKIRADQHSRKRNSNQLVAMPYSSISSSGGCEGSRISLGGGQERRLEARRLAILWSVSTQADCHGQFQSFIC